MILQWDIVVKLHLESFCSSNLVHFWPECGKSRWTNTRFKWSRKKILCSGQLSRVERQRISISPMPDTHNDLIDVDTQLAPPIWSAKLVIFLKTDRQLRSWKILENNVKFSSKMVSILRKIFSICTETLICTFNYQN